MRLHSLSFRCFSPQGSPTEYPPLRWHILCHQPFKILIFIILTFIIIVVINFTPVYFMYKASLFRNGAHLTSTTDTSPGHQHPTIPPTRLLRFNSLFQERLRNSDFHMGCCCAEETQRSRYFYSNPWF